MQLTRLFLSHPHMGGEEMRFVREAFESNYIAPLGPQVDAFEREFAEYVGIKHCVAVSSGTAAMHLALRLLDVGPGDEVFAPWPCFGDDEIEAATRVLRSGKVNQWTGSEVTSFEIWVKYFFTFYPFRPKAPVKYKTRII
jgi:dTDP-4-amino-4,6-dideoxygalactose transaminase